MTCCALKMGRVPFDYPQIREKYQPSCYKGILGDNTILTLKWYKSKAAIGLFLLNRAMVMQR